VEYGPVDVVVLAAGSPKFDGSVLAELESLAKAGTIRLLDAMILAKNEHGACLTLNIEDLPAEERASLAFIETGTRGLFDSEDADTLFEGMVPGSAVVALAIEHAWSVPLIKSFMNAGVEVALNYRLPAAVVNAAIAEASAGAN
jgi:hypothetical protein